MFLSTLKHRKKD